MLGGTSAVGPEVVAAVRALGVAVVGGQDGRLAGASRFETAVAVAAALPTTDTVLIARGADDPDPTRTYADGLAAGGWAAASGWPVLLTLTDRLHPAAAAFLATHPAITPAIIVGGEAAVGGSNEAALRDLGLDVSRVAGPDRASTATAIAVARGAPTAAHVDRLILLDGQAADAHARGFPAAAHSAATDAPIVLAAGDDLPPATAAWLDAGAGARGDGSSAGEPDVVCAASAPACAEARPDGSTRHALTDADVTSGPLGVVASVAAVWVIEPHSAVALSDLVDLRQRCSTVVIDGRGATAAALAADVSTGDVLTSTPAGGCHLRNAAWAGTVEVLRRDASPGGEADGPPLVVTGQAIQPDDGRAQHPGPRHRPGRARHRPQPRPGRGGAPGGARPAVRGGRRPRHRGAGRGRADPG